MCRRCRFVVWVVASLTLASGCGSSSGLEATGGTLAFDEPAETRTNYGPLAVHAYPPSGEEALVGGELEITDDCVLLNHGGATTLLLWPAAAVTWDQANRTVTYETAAGERVLLADGDQVAFGGGASSADQNGSSVKDFLATVDWVSEPREKCLTDSRWFVGEYAGPAELSSETPDVDDALSGDSLENTMSTTTAREIDSEGLLARFGFERCGGSLIPNSDLTDERRQEIYQAMLDADIGQGAALDPGYRAWLTLYVLDEPTLSTLAKIADPSEVCLEGQDPNDYVPLGPQQLEGPGWRWVGAGAGNPTGRSVLITNQADYDELWPHLGEGPEVEQLDVDFEDEVILAISHSSGVNFGRCGRRFDGYSIQGDTVVIDWPAPGGLTRCLLSIRPATYAVALDRNVVVSGKLTAIFRGSPNGNAAESTNIFPGSVMSTTG